MVRSKGGPSQVKPKADKAQVQAQKRREQLAAAAEARMAALHKAAGDQQLWCSTVACTADVALCHCNHLTVRLTDADIAFCPP